MWGAAGDDDGTDGVRVLVDGVGGVAGGVRVAGAQVEWFDCWGVVGVQPLELPAQLTRNDSPTTTCRIRMSSYCQFHSRTPA